MYFYFYFCAGACARLAYFLWFFVAPIWWPLSTSATNLGGEKEDWNGDFGREENQMAEVGQGRTLSGDLDKF